MASVHPNLAFDTLAFAKTLIAKGYDQKAAEALAEAQREFFVQNLATKETVESAVHGAKTELKLEIAEVRQEIADVKSELKQEISELRQEVVEVKYAIKEVDNKIDREIALLENRLTKTLGRMFFAAVSILAIIMPVVYIALQKLLFTTP